jgi:hypothetical protein
VPPRWLGRVVEEVRRCGRTRAVDYIKIVLRQRCVVISFHEREETQDDDDA